MHPLRWRPANLADIAVRTRDLGRHRPNWPARELFTDHRLLHARRGPHRLRGEDQYLPVHQRAAPGRAHVPERGLVKARPCVITIPPIPPSRVRRCRHLGIRSSGARDANCGPQPTCSPSARLPLPHEHVGRASYGTLSGRDATALATDPDSCCSINLVGMGPEAAHRLATPPRAAPKVWAGDRHDRHHVPLLMRVLRLRLRLDFATLTDGLPNICQTIPGRPPPTSVRIQTLSRRARAPALLSWSRLMALLEVEGLRVATVPRVMASVSRSRRLTAGSSVQRAGSPPPSPPLPPPLKPGLGGVRFDCTDIAAVPDRTRRQVRTRAEGRLVFPRSASRTPAPRAWCRRRNTTRSSSAAARVQYFPRPSNDSPGRRHPVRREQHMLAIAALFEPRLLRS